MILASVIHVPATVSLGLIASIITGAITLSVRQRHRRAVAAARAEVSRSPA
jgi:hypothetical protein